MADATTQLSRLLYGILPQMEDGPSGVIERTTTSYTNTSTGEENAWTFALPANTLSADGKAVRVTVFGNTAANANNKTVRLYFGSTVWRTIINGGVNNEVWSATGIAFRTGAASQELDVTSSSGSTVFTNRGTASETMSGAITIKVTLQGAAASDLVFRSAVVELL